tara:strand:- start:1604 stop:2089 length:486 start_codon:yes stop_codon:yes gene_type:complete
LSNNYNFYKSSQFNKGLSLSNEFDFIWFAPKFYRLKLHKGSIIKYFFWYLFTLGGYKILYINDRQKNDFVHWSHVISKTWQFPFMSKNDKQIISCYTKPSVRGKGLYPFAIQQIAKKYSDLWILSNIKNQSSNIGITKTGFKLVGIGYKTIFKRYFIDAKS